MRTYFSSARRTVVCAFVSLAMVGCASPKQPVYVPGTDPTVEELKRTMTREHALNHMKRLVTEYVNSLAFGVPTDGIWCQMEVTRFDEQGFTYVERGALHMTDSVALSGGAAWEFIHRHLPQDRDKAFVYTNDIPFSGFTHVEVFTQKDAPARLRFYCGTNTGSFAFDADVKHSKPLYEETLAAVEILCANLTSALPERR